jgi:UDPglucose--hexose-1-phosphate uridylyltransferase
MSAVPTETADRSRNPRAERLARTTVVQPDGRHVYLYGTFQSPPASYIAPALTTGEWQQRWNPLRQEWVMYASGRQGRTFLPDRSSCPLCPSTEGHSTEIPASAYDAAVFDNRFPAVRSEAPTGPLPPGAKPSAGVSEVVVYTDRHEGSFGTLPADRLDALVDIWADRHRELGRRPDVRYVFMFENRGEAVGVTLHHPHGQIIGYPLVPPVPSIELAAAARHQRRTGTCMHCALVADERRAKVRVVLERDGIVSYVPLSARWPYEVHVVPTRHVGALPDASRAARRALGRSLQAIAAAYDRLFDAPMPYMMALHQRPTDGRDHPEAHLHVEFYPILRDAGKQKYLAGSESAAGVFVNDTLPENTAATLRTKL